MSSPSRPTIQSVPSGTSSGASSLAQPSPLTTAAALVPGLGLGLGLGGLPGVPRIVEDEDAYEDRPPRITVEDEQVDEFPFDPSIPDEMLFQEAYDQDACTRDAAVVEPAHGMQARLSRLLSTPSLPSLPSLPSVPSIHGRVHGRDEAESFTHRWMTRLHLRRGGNPDGEGEAEGGEDGSVPEPGVLLSSRSPAAAKMRLVPLAEAQGRPDIANRPEGFELAEAKMRGMP